MALFAMRPGEGRPCSGRQLPELALERLDVAAAASLLAGRRDELDPGERYAEFTAVMGLQEPAAPSPQLPAAAAVEPPRRDRHPLERVTTLDRGT